jgi:hypothetical protein
MNYLDRLEALDQEITRAADAPATLQALYLKRAELKVELALPTAEVDALLAHAIRKNPNVTGLSVEALGLLFDQDILNSPAPFGELGIIGEAIRIYVRDELLSRAGSKNVGRWLFRSTLAFSQALKLMDDSTPRKFRAWAHAHLGASLATLYWLAFTVHADGSPVFASAEASFQAALELGPYPWAKRFLGLLYAVRGQSGDYQRTAALLDSVAKGKDGDQASLHRSEAILYANIAWNVSGTDTPTLAEAIDAAKSGAQEGTLAGQKDPDDPLGLHFRATNVFFLYGTDQALYGDRLKLAVDSAVSRSKNQFSQTCVSLASLALVQALQLSDSGSSTAAAIAEAVTRIHQLQSSGVIDLETNLLFQRDPVMQILRNNLYDNKPLPTSFQPAIDALKDYDAFRMQWFVLDETILQSI